MSFWRILTIFALVHLCGGNPKTPVCNVTHDSQGWHYTIIGEYTPPCDFYEWLNETNHTLANSIQNESADVVQWHNSTHLHSKVCLRISRKRDCHTEPHPQIINCPVSCIKNEEAPPSDGTIVRSRKGIGGVVVLLVVLLVFFLVAKKRHSLVSFYHRRLECIRNARNPRDVM